MGYIDIEQLDKKVKAAIEDDLFTGQEIFTEEELNHLRNCVRIHPNLSIKEVNYFFVLITNYTKEIDPGCWRDELLKRFNCDSNNTLTKLFEEIFEKVSTRRFLFNSGKKYYSTFMCHALAPIESIYSFFSLCYYTFFCQPLVYDEEGEIDFKAYADVFKKRFKTSLNSDSGIDLGGHFYDIRIGIKRLADEYPKRFTLLFQKTYEYLDKLSQTPNYTLDENDNYFVQLINLWCEKNMEEVSTREYERDEYEERPSDILSHPEVSFKLLSDNLYLSISNFRVDCDDEIKFEIYNNDDDEPIDYGYLDISFESIVMYAKGRDIRLESNQIIDLKLVITAGDKEIASFDLNRDFILFPFTSSGRSAKEIKGNKLKAGDYILYCDDFENVIGKHTYPDELVRFTFSPSLFSMSTEDGDLLESDNRRIIFFEKEEYEKPELIIPNTKAIYCYKGHEYYIISDKKVFFRYNKEADQFAIRCFDADHLDSRPLFETEITETQVDSYEDSQIATIQLNKVTNDTPYIIRLFDKTNASGYFLSEKRIIYIPNFSISYLNGVIRPETCFNGEAVPFNVNYDDKLISYDGDEETPFFLGGTLKLINPPFFKCFIDEVQTPKTPFNIYYNQINPSSIISFFPRNIDFEVMIDDKVINNNNKFGQYVYSYVDSRFAYKNVVVRYHDSLNTEHIVNLMRVFYKPAFIADPLTKPYKELPFRLKWSPKNILLGCKNPNPIFTLDIGNGKYIKHLSLSDEEIDLHGIIPYGNVSISVSFKNGYADENIYLPNKQIEVGGRYETTFLKSEKYIPITKVAGMQRSNSGYGKTWSDTAFLTELSHNHRYYLAYKASIYDNVTGEEIYIGQLCLQNPTRYEPINTLDGVSFKQTVIIYKKVRDIINAQLKYFIEDVDIKDINYIKDKESGYRFVVGQNRYHERVLSIDYSYNVKGIEYYDKIYQIKNDITEDS